MSVLWCGGEDIDFPNGTAPTVDTTSTNFRSTYARCDVGISGGASGMAKSTLFPGGAVTSCWITFRVIHGTTTVHKIQAGVGLGGTSKGLFFGSDATTSTKAALSKYDGTTITQLASESGNSLVATLQRVDMQIVNYGASATVNVYLDGVLIITFSGDVTVAGMTNFDSVFFSQNSTTNFPRFSEFIVADEDLRAWPGLMTLALTGAGTTDNWTASTFGNINGTSINDASPMSVNSNAQDSQFNVTDLPTGSFIIKAVRIAARMAKSASPAVTQVKLGYNDGGTVAFGTGATKALTTAYTTYDQLDSLNPNGGAAFTQSLMNALQLDAQSLT